MALLLVICSASYLRGYFPNFFESNKTGCLGVFRSAAVIGKPSSLLHHRRPPLPLRVRGLLADGRGQHPDQMRDAQDEMMKVLFISSRLRHHANEGDLSTLPVGPIVAQIRLPEADIDLLIEHCVRPSILPVGYAVSLLVLHQHIHSLALSHSHCVLQLDSVWGFAISEAEIDSSALLDDALIHSDLVVNFEIHV